MNGRPRVELFVDELVLRGIPPERARQVADAIEAALDRRAGGLGPAPARNRDEAARRGADVSAPAGDPAALGEAVAESVWQAITGDRGGRGAGTVPR